MEKAAFFSEIDRNIKLYGYHITIVTGGPCPRFSYTIGLKDKLGYELIFAGGENFSIDEVKIIIQNLYTSILENFSTDNNHMYNTSLGEFTISNADPTWSNLLALGVFDFYQTKQIKTCQVIPEQRNRTLDVPDLAKKYGAHNEPIWKWLTVDWPYLVSFKSIAITNIGCLYGQKATEVTRWEDNEWEIFAGTGPDIEKENIRIVPLATLLGIDSSLEPVLKLNISDGIWRDATELIWHKWN